MGNGLPGLKSNSSVDPLFGMLQLKIANENMSAMNFNCQLFFL